MTKIFLDCFSGSVAELKPKEKGDIAKVLVALSRDPNVSTWDMDDNKRYPLWKTIKKLEDLSYIKSMKKDYPWFRYEITDLGKKFLLELESQ